MLMYFYVGALVFGGVLLLSSVVLGHHDADGDFDLDGDGGLDSDGDVDAEHEITVEKDIDLSGDIGLFWVLRSIRFWMFFLAFFGLTGVLFQGLGLIEKRTRGPWPLRGTWRFHRRWLRGSDPHTSK